MHGALTFSSRMLGLYLWMLIFGFSKLCSGYDVICTVSEDPRGVLYSVPEFEASDCWYSWADSNHTVLANHRGRIEELIERESNRTLLLKKCKVLIYYSRNCLSEGGPRRGKCTAPCTTKQTRIPTASRRFQPNWTVISLAISAALLVLVGLVLCFVFRDRICRDPSCFYTLVKRQDTRERRASKDFGIPF